MIFKLDIEVNSCVTIFCYQTTGSTCLACYTLGSSSGPLSAAGNGDADLNDESDPGNET